MWICFIPISPQLLLANANLALAIAGDEVASTRRHALREEERGVRHPEEMPAASNPRSPDETDLHRLRTRQLWHSIPVAASVTIKRAH